jgi:hypothetical protein
MNVDWPRNSFSGNICFEFSVLVLCSVYSMRLLENTALLGVAGGVRVSGDSRIQ